MSTANYSFTHLGDVMIESPSGVSGKGKGGMEIAIAVLILLYLLPIVTMLHLLAFLILISAPSFGKIICVRTPRLTLEDTNCMLRWSFII